MLDFLKALSELSSFERMPWRWWVGFALGLAGMVAILVYEKDEIAVLYIFLELVATVALTALWQWRAEDRARKRGGGRGRRAG